MKWLLWRDFTLFKKRGLGGAALYIALILIYTIMTILFCVVTSSNDESLNDMKTGAISCFGGVNLSTISLVIIAFQFDEKDKVKDTLLSMPVSINNYVLEKYIFFYILLLPLFILGFVSSAFGIYTVESISFYTIGISLIPLLYIPISFILDSEKAYLIIIFLSLTIGYLFIQYIYNLIVSNALICIILFSVITICLALLSYKISVKYCTKK